MPTLMVSISGIRGIVGDGLTPEVIVKYTSAYADFIKQGKVIVGRDARITGDMVSKIVIGTLLAKGLDVIDIGIVPTPTVQFTVKTLEAQGGIAITASHNPNEWNALKLLNSTGQFMSPEEHEEMKTYLSKEVLYESWQKVGRYSEHFEAIDNHIESILKLNLINVEKIKSKKFKVLLDCVNGAGVYSVPRLLDKLGVEFIQINCDKSGIFPRLPEPLPENLIETMKAVKENKVDLGIVVDPDVDRLVLITDEGVPFGEENTITQVVKFILSKTPGNVVVNLSTTRAVEDVAKEFGCKVFRSPVGEANVVKRMKEVDAVIGGEGSGGVIYPSLHYGRDALVGIALTLQHLAEKDITLSDLKRSLPEYFIAKKKIELQNVSPDEIINSLIFKYKNQNLNTDDGLRIDFADHWVHLRKSNTEPIIRIIVEAKNKELAESLAEKYLKEIQELV
ncbi:MAG: phosphoglucosamine mutase [Ignavibacterium sp.]|uniref:phosphoglucosamine mutase n=1 Tax=Ignavibacterium sp. TaxID=2651167 RepID=UPI0021DB9D1D|nr:phosphoglucosamine mutase [Ignavibacterium sp.]BDQ02028.1 MAG: phosphoglucosamine mutase [Ignavibacterium sp.]GIV45240.1 MAG: phosphoglucosamine mutase [Ignavibacterium sp.]